MGIDIAVLANDSDIDSPTVRIASTTSPAHGSVTVNPDGTITYTPDANFNGTDTFTYRVTDGTLSSAPATVTVTVKPSNDAPVAQNSFISTPEDTPISDHVLVSDGDSATLTVTLVSAPTHGTVTLDPNGTFSYVPALNYNGTDSFTFKASDGSSQSNIGTVNIAIAPVDDAPVCSAATPSVSEIWPANHQMVPVTINGVTDLDSSSIAVTITGIYQDEPTNSTGDGNTATDASGVGMSFAQVRGERSGTPKVPGNGRVYHIQFRASDGMLTCAGEVKVGVPHDQGNKKTLIDDGIKFNSVTGAVVP
jgi:VCBS repeat-containing protein